MHSLFAVTSLFVPHAGLPRVSSSGEGNLDLGNCVSRKWKHVMIYCGRLLPFSSCCSSAFGRVCGRELDWLLLRLTNPACAVLYHLHGGSWLLRGTGLCWQCEVSPMSSIAPNLLQRRDSVVVLYDVMLCKRFSICIKVKPLCCSLHLMGSESSSKSWSWVSWSFLEIALFAQYKSMFTVPIPHFSYHLHITVLMKTCLRSDFKSWKVYHQ